MTITLTRLQVELTAPVLLLVEGQAPAVQFAGRTLTKEQAEQLAHDLLDVVTEIDTARWYAVNPVLAARMEADATALDDEQLERMAS